MSLYIAAPALALSPLLVNREVRRMELLMIPGQSDVMAAGMNGWTEVQDVTFISYNSAFGLDRVGCWVGHMNNKATTEPLWLAADVLHSHHPSQTGDHWREWLSLLKWVLLHHEKADILTERLASMSCLIYQKVERGQCLCFSVFSFSSISNKSAWRCPLALLPTLTHQSLHTATIMKHFAERHKTFVALKCTPGHTHSHTHE